jgi:hypothetical protein
MTPEERRLLLEGLMEDKDRLIEGPPEGPWDLLAADRLSAEHEDELRRRAATDPEVALALEAFAPLGDAFEDDLIRRIQRERAPAPAPAPAWRRWAPWAVALVAAGLALAPRPQPVLPRYEAEFAGADRVVRGEDGGAPVEISRDGAVQILLRPDVRATGHAEAAVWVVTDAPPRRVAAAEVDDGGALRIVIPAADLGPPGEARLRVVIGRDVDTIDPDHPPADAQVFPHRVIVLPR